MKKYDGTEQIKERVDQENERQNKLLENINAILVIHVMTFFTDCMHEDYH